MGDVPEAITVTEDGLTLPVTEVLAGRGFITGKSGSGKSILEGTPIYTDEGRKPIEDVREGERVLSLNKHSYEQEFREVLATIEHEADDLLRITLEDGTELVGTEDHSFLTVRDLEIVPVKGSDLVEGTWIPLSREIPPTETRSQIDLADYVIEANNVIVRDEEIQSGPAVADRFLDLTFDSGKVLGLYLAEGSLSSRYTVQISNVDSDVKNFLQTQDFKVYERTSNRAFKPFGEFVRQEFETGAANKRIPNWVFNAPQNFKAGLISGYFDGDGTINDHDVTVISKSPDLIRGIKELLRHFGISSTIREKMVLSGEGRVKFERLAVDSFCLERFEDIVSLSVRDKARKLASVNRAAADGGTFNSKDMVPNFGPVLNYAASERGWTERDSGNRSGAASIHQHTRKQKVGRGTLNRVIEDLGLEGRLKQYATSDIQWKRVSSVEPLDETRTVYDLDVAVNDNFIANGVFVHNSNSASVVIEELLENNFAVMIIDTDGEYYGLKERYEVLHVGAGPECDVEVGPAHAATLAEMSLMENVPVILDISAFLDAEEGRELVREAVETLFRKEGSVRKPFLLLVEEVHEFLPESGGLDELGELLVRVAKRGRKRGLGMCGISQRPAAVDKDFITQCDWLVWHRLTWDNDTRVVKGILGSDAADTVQELGDGEALLMTDWDDEVQQVQFRRKRTFDAGATPGLGDFERPDLKSVGEDLVAELQKIDEQAGTTAKQEDLEAEIEEKEERIATLEAKVDELAAELERREAEAETATERAAELEARLERYEEAAEIESERVEALETELEREQAATAEARQRASELESELERLEEAAEAEEREEREEILAPIGGSGADTAPSEIEAAPSKSTTEDGETETESDLDAGVGEVDDGGPQPDDDPGGILSLIAEETVGTVFSSQDEEHTDADRVFPDDAAANAKGNEEPADGGPAQTEDEEDRDRRADSSGQTAAGIAGQPGGRTESATASDDAPDDPLWEIGDLFVYVFGALGRFLVGGARLASGERDSSARPLSGGGGTSALGTREDRILLATGAVIAIAVALVLFFFLT